MTPALFRAAYRRVATSRTGTKGNLSWHALQPQQTPNPRPQPSKPGMSQAKATIHSGSRLARHGHTATAKGYRSSSQSFRRTARSSFANRSPSSEIQSWRVQRAPILAFAQIEIRLVSVVDEGKSFAGARIKPLATETFCGYGCGDDFPNSSINHLISMRHNDLLVTLRDSRIGINALK
jgi:hypothetical protein